MNGIYVELDDARINAYRRFSTLTSTLTLALTLLLVGRNQGGFDMIGSGRHKIETPEQFASSAQHCKALSHNRNTKTQRDPGWTSSTS